MKSIQFEFPADNIIKITIYPTVKCNEVFHCPVPFVSQSRYINLFIFFSRVLAERWSQKENIFHLCDKHWIWTTEMKKQEVIQPNPPKDYLQYKHLDLKLESDQSTDLIMFDLILWNLKKIWIFWPHMQITNKMRSYTKYCEEDLWLHSLCLYGWTSFQQ